MVGAQYFISLALKHPPIGGGVFLVYLIKTAVCAARAQTRESVPRSSEPGRFQGNFRRTNWAPVWGLSRQARWCPWGCMVQEKNRVGSEARLRSKNKKPTLSIPNRRNLSDTIPPWKGHLFLSGMFLWHPSIQKIGLGMKLQRKARNRK